MKEEGKEELKKAEVEKNKSQGYDVKEVVESVSSFFQILGGSGSYYFRKSLKLSDAEISSLLQKRSGEVLSLIVQGVVADKFLREEKRYLKEAKKRGITLFALFGEVVGATVKKYVAEKAKERKTISSHLRKMSEIVQSTKEKN